MQLQNNHLNVKKKDDKTKGIVYLNETLDRLTKFQEKHGKLYDFLENLVTSKITIYKANADQISFIINLM